MFTSSFQTLANWSSFSFATSVFHCILSARSSLFLYRTPIVPCLFSYFSLFIGFYYISVTYSGILEQTGTAMFLVKCIGDVTKYVTRICNGFRGITSIRIDAVIYNGHLATLICFTRYISPSVEEVTEMYFWVCDGMHTWFSIRIISVCCVYLFLASYSMFVTGFVSLLSINTSLEWIGTIFLSF